MVTLPDLVWRPGGAARRRFLAIREKPQGGLFKHPPAGWRLIRDKLTLALLNLVRPYPLLGGGGGFVAPPSISVTNRRGGKFKRQWRALDEVVQLKLKNLTTWSPKTLQVRSNTKCLTFPFNAFPPQNAEYKRISILWIDMIRLCNISKHRHSSLARGDLLSRSSEVTVSNCRFRTFGVVTHVYGSVFRLEREKWP